jgi:hypothetical protein
VWHERVSFHFIASVNANEYVSLVYSYNIFSVILFAQILSYHVSNQIEIYDSAANENKSKTLREKDIY